MISESPGGSMVPPAGADLDAALVEYRRSGSHWARYRLAARLLRGGSVLDVGCGHGMGAALLAPEFGEYVGVDTDAEAIAWAQRAVAHRVPHARFVERSAADRELAGRRFDVVLCFEVLEHVDAPAQLLQELFGRLAPGGQVLLSTPNGTVSAGDPRKYRSPYHVHEFRADEVEDLLAPLTGTRSYYQERRWDRLDTVGLALGVAEAGPGRDRPAPGRSLSRWVARHWDGPAFWRIIPARLAEMDSRRFSTIVVRCSAPTGTAPPATA